MKKILTIIILFLTTTTLNANDRNVELDKLFSELKKNIPSSSVSGSGRGGKITKDDALKALPKVDLKAIVKNRNIESKSFQCLEEK